ncbi:MAG: alpha/beta hydrolase [Paracoccaceae bacterium]
MRRRTLLGLGGAAGVAAAAGLPAWFGYRRAMAAARQRIARPTNATMTRFGAMQWAEAGHGTPVLMLHGTGGGFDQGLLFARRLSAAGWRIVAPSRFGYLGSDFPDDPSPANQADALADLLDALGIDRVSVIGGSAGAISAIEFAIRHPGRCHALVALVPATYAPDRPPMRPNATGAAIMRHALQSDFLFWLGITLSKDAMTATLLATDPALVRAAPLEEQARARAILQGILPVSERIQGLLNDAEQAGNPAPQALDMIEARTLAISLQDDRFLTLDAARHIAKSVRGAKLASYPTGGHIWIGHDAEIFAEIDRFLRAA